MPSTDPVEQLAGYEAKEFTADERDRLMRLINQGVLVDEGGTVQPSIETSIETRESLTLGRRTAHGSYPHGSRFRTPLAPDPADH